MSTIRFLLISSSFLFTVIIFFIRDPGVVQKNNAPQVHITSPNNSDRYAWNTVMPYTVTVSDKEDGESKYGEIPAAEIFLELRYFPDPINGALFVRSTQKEPAGFSAIRKQDCFNCHTVHSKLIGPSFSDISGRYKTLPDVAALASHIIKGSTGIWGAAMMPTHPDLSEKEAQLIVQWIIENTNDPDVDYFRGGEGSLRVRPSPNATADGVFVLKATYADHGIDNLPSSSLMGQDVISLNLKNN
ncbi:MAG: c-type cytochrome [Chitinophagaceae bacterium]|nr:c-type cytochrome [Chitinophagaceae bacterium]